MSAPLPLDPNEYEARFRSLLARAAGTPEGPARVAILKDAFELARREHYAAEPHPSAPDPLADLRRDCVLHLRMCDLLELGEVFNPPDLLSGFTRRIDGKARRLYATGAIRRQPPQCPDIIPNGRTRARGWIVEPAREVVRAVFDWCEEARAERAPPAPESPASDAQPLATTSVPPPHAHEPVPPAGPNARGGTGYTLGQLIGALDGIERNREFRRLQQQDQLRRDPLNAAINAMYSSALAWQPDEREMPGIRRIELLCDLEPGDAGINAAKVRRLRARICHQQHWQPPHADQLTLAEAADLLEGVRQVPIQELERVEQDCLYHGLGTLDVIFVGPDERVQVTGLSCKVIAGTAPTACPDANPVLPPSMLPLAERAIRRLYPLPEGATVHWVGHDTGMRNRCRCHPDAPFAAPFDRHRWAAVPVPTDEKQQLTVRSTPPLDVSSPPAPPAETAPFTVCDIRDLLVYRVQLASHRAGLKQLDPGKVLAASVLPTIMPNVMPMQYAELVCALTPPTPPRLTDETVWTLATYRRLVGLARVAGRDAPDESDLMGLVGTVAARTGQTIEELLRMPEGDFDRTVACQATAPSSDALARIMDASRCPECNTSPNQLDLAAGGTAPCRNCGLWGLATGRCLTPLADNSSGPISLQLHAPYWVRITSRATGLPAPPDDAAATIRLRDHAGREHSVPLAECRYNGRPACPDYLARTPDRLGDPWLVERLLAGRELGLWVTREGIWFVLDRERGEAVALNGSQLHDLQACPVVTTTTPGPPTLDPAPEAEAARKTGRPPDPTKQEVVRYVGELREQKVPWKNIPDAVFKKFGVRYTSETLRGYLKNG